MFVQRGIVILSPPLGQFPPANPPAAAAQSGGQQSTTWRPFGHNLDQSLGRSVIFTVTLEFPFILTLFFRQ